MSEKQIVKGDMVIVVAPTPCCGSTEKLGYIGTVTSTSPFADGIRYTICVGCGNERMNDGTEVEIDHMGWSERRRLRRIDPGALDEDVPHAETIAA